MTIINPIFGPCKLRLSLISYSCDVANAGGVIIPLGVIADISLGGGSIHGLGLIGRKEIAETESAQVGQLFRGMISKPYEMLKAEFDRVWVSQDALEAFSRLPIVHDTSLTFSRIDESIATVPRNLLSNPEENRSALKAWAIDKLIAHRNDAYWSFLDEHWMGGPVKRDTDERLAA
jgi:hypothetical protein